MSRAAGLRRAAADAQDHRCRALIRTRCRTSVRPASLPSLATMQTVALVSACTRVDWTGSLPHGCPEPLQVVPRAYTRAGEQHLQEADKSRSHESHAYISAARHERHRSVPHDGVAGSRLGHGVPVNLGGGPAKWTGDVAEHSRSRDFARRQDQSRVAQRPAPGTLRDWRQTGRNRTCDTAHTHRSGGLSDATPAADRREARCPYPGGGYLRWHCQSRRPSAPDTDPAGSSATRRTPLRSRCPWTRSRPSARS
jgi:hypothetical protein